MRQPRTAHWFPAGHAAQQGGSLANSSTLAPTGSTPGSTAARLTICLSSTGIERDLVSMRHVWLARGQHNPAQAVRHPLLHQTTACRPEAAATNTQYVLLISFLGRRPWQELLMMCRRYSRMMHPAMHSPKGCTWLWLCLWLPQQILAWPMPLSCPTSLPIC